MWAHTSCVERLDVLVVLRTLSPPIRCDADVRRSSPWSRRTSRSGRRRSRDAAPGSTRGRTDDLQVAGDPPSSGNTALRSRSVRSDVGAVGEPPPRRQAVDVGVDGNVGTPNACAITTLAVLWPTPASDSRKSHSGNTSPPASTIWLAAVQMFAAFVGASPTSRITSRISAGSRAAICCGVDAIANSFGVTSLTFLSVVCAERATATSSVYGSRWSSGTGGWGYNSSSIWPISSAFSRRRMPADGTERCCAERATPRVTMTA